MLLSSESSAITTVVNSMVSSFTSQASDIASGVGSIIVPLLPIVGVVAVVFLGIKIFRRVAR